VESLIGDDGAAGLRGHFFDLIARDHHSSIQAIQR